MGRFLWRGTLAVARKEAIDALRDRRSLTAAFVYSLFGPLVMGLALGAVARAGSAAEGPMMLVVDGAERAPSLAASLARQRVSVAPPPLDLESAVRQGRVEAALVVPPDYPGEHRALRSATVRLLYDASRSSGRTAARRVRTVLETYGREVAAARLVARGITPEVARPVTLVEVDLATRASRSAAALATLPIFLMVAAFVCCMNAVIDATAGERERGSLEPLLAHPVPPAVLAAGKWLPSAALSLAGVVLTLAVSGLVLGAERLQEIGVPIGLGAADIRGLLGLLLPLAFLAPALQMLIAIFARSFKEAQTYLSLLLFVPMLPGFLFAFDAAGPRPWMRAVPIVGQQILMADLLRGEPAPAGAASLLAVLTLLVAVACVAAAARCLREERIVLGRS
jgi:sodium transport system permease protein